MKGIKYLLTGLVFGMVFGWALGFLRIPYLEKNFSFLLGFVVALAFASLVVLWLTAWNRGFLPVLTGKKTANGNAQSTRAHTRSRILLTGIVVLGAVMGGVSIYRQIGSLQLQIQNRDKRLKQMTARLELIRKQDTGPLLRSVLDDVEKEIKHNPGRVLRDTTIGRIAALSFTLKPYRYIQGDSLSEQAFSPERGQLLQTLVLMQIDSGSFNRIKRKTTFAGADLKGIDLHGLDLSGINLQGANIKSANLGGTNLTDAHLEDANFWGSNLNRANLSRADLKRADLSWAQLNQATLTFAILNGAKLSSAQLTKADLNGASFRTVESDGALLNEARLTRIDFFSCNLAKADLSQADLSYSDLRLINLNEADVVGIQLTKAVVDENWLEKVKKWQLRGATELQSYQVVNDTLDQWKGPLFRLKKAE